MIIHLHKNFKKQFNKLTKPQRIKFKERRNIFLQDEFSSILNNHALKGVYQDYRSINVTGGIRVIYKKEKDVVIFVTIGSHSKLYR